MSKHDKPQGIYLAIPTIHSMWAKLAYRLWETRDSVPCPVVLGKPAHGSAPTVVSAGRNKIVREFLATSCEWMVQIDSDTVPPPSFLNTLVLEAHRLGKRFTCCPYPLWSLDGKFQYALGTFPKSELHIERGGALTSHLPDWCKAIWHAQIPEGWSTWDCAGTGCFAVHRSILEQLSRPWFEQWKYDEDGIELLSTEDTLFCWKVWKETGVKIETHSSLLCEHWHSIDLTRAMIVQQQLCDAIERAYELPVPAGK